MKSGGCLLFFAVALMTGCGKQERTEAVQLAKVLTAKKANLASANTIERDLVGRARAWCGGISANGAGRGVELERNAAVASELAKSAVAASTELSAVRQAVVGVPLKEEFPRNVRNVLITELTKRQRLLQDVRALLEQSATQLLEYRQSKTYVGDTYPDGIGKLDALLKSYKEPEDAVDTALAALKAKYNLSESEL